MQHASKARIVVRPYARTSAVWTVACDGQAHGRYFDRADALDAARALGKKLDISDIAVAFA